MSDEDVQDWYTERTSLTTFSSKVYDWSLLTDSDVCGKDVLNEGPSQNAVDEIVLAPFAKSWTSIDFTEEVIRRCHRLVREHRSDIRFDIGDFRDLPYSSESFDTVLDFSSSDHVEHRRERCYGEAYRVLRANGLYVVTFANRHCYDCDETRDHFGYEVHMRPEQMIANLKAAGFVIECSPNINTMRSGILGRKR